MKDFDISEVLTKEERIAFSLRYLYKDAGYEMFRMSKFEEYDFYAKNKNFLLSDNVITFTDTDGRLMAMKPDVTLSIIKNSDENNGELTKVYYNENVYRVSRGTKSFKEFMQSGLECIGNIEDSDIVEVIALAAKSLDVISDSNVLELSNLDIVTGVLAAYPLSLSARSEILKLLGEKNFFGVNEVCISEGLSECDAERISKLVSLYGAPEKVKNELSEFALTDGLKNEIERFIAVIDALGAYGISDKLCIDFSVMNDMNYYNGFAFRGFVEGIPTGILSGGQYDKLMKKMHKNSGAIGFAVYLDELLKL